MRAGRERSDVPYVWPATLLTPVRPPAIVYLDLNHWIELSKELVGRSEGSQHQTVLNECIEAVNRGRAIFPVCASLYMEINRIQNYRQRRDIRAAIECVGGFKSILDLSRQAMHEIEAALDNFIGKRLVPCSNDQYIGWGFEHALGINRRLFNEPERNEDNRTNSLNGLEASNKIPNSLSLKLNQQVIDGPSPEEKEDYRKHGWQPLEGLRAIDKNADLELEQQRKLSQEPKWRRGRLRDVVSARELHLEFNDILTRALDARNVARLDQTGKIRMDNIFQQKGDVRGLVDAMPTLDVLVSLKTEYHKNPQYRWKRNDIYDIYSMASSIPYCDIVVSDKSICSQVIRSGLNDRLNTKILTKVSEIFQFLL